MKKVSYIIKRIFEKIKEVIKPRYALRREINRDIKIGTELNLLLLAHSLEKGMGIECPRKGYGVEKAKRLVVDLNKYKNATSDSNKKYAYQEALSVLECWISYSEENGVDCNSIKEKLAMLNCDKDIRIPAGYHIYKPQELYSKLDYEQIQYFMSSRHSVRSFKNNQVTKEQMDEIFKLAACAPSACNRQPVKIFWTSDPEKVSQIDKLIPGNQGFEGVIPNYAIITVDKKMFSPSEILQWYVNGGIYVSYFIQALHANHLGGCIFQMPITHPNISKIREIAGIRDNYAVVCAIGCGEPKDTVKCLRATRKDSIEYNEQF